MEKNKDPKGIDKRELNWFMQVITLGDRFDPKDFFDRLKKSIVEFSVIFFGILLSFYVEQQWGESEEREDSIENLTNLQGEIGEMIDYTIDFKQNLEIAKELINYQHERWDEDDDFVFIDLRTFDIDSSYSIPLDNYTNRLPFNPPRVTYDAIKLDGTFRLLDDVVGRKMTEIYDGTNLKFLIENTSEIEQKFIDRFKGRVTEYWVKDLDYVDLDNPAFWIENRKYVQNDRFLKYNLFERLVLWNYSVFKQLDGYTEQLKSGKQMIDSILDVRESEIQILYWVINKKERE